MELKPSGSAREIRQRIQEQYGWRINGEWTAEQLEILWQAGQAIQQGVEKIKGRSAKGWVRRYLPAVFAHKPQVAEVRALKGKSFVFPRRRVWMGKGFENGHHPVRHVVHELGHVLDNRLGSLLPATFIGGGPADQMLRQVGGQPERGGVRFRPNPHYAAIVTPAEHWADGAYGNVSVSEDFAEAFCTCLIHPEETPPQRLEWMRNFLRRLE